MIYLDNAASTKPTPNVINTVSKTMEFFFANPSSLHGLGIKAHEQLETYRRLIAKNLGLTPEWIIFTSGATEANQTVLKCATKNSNKKRNHILMTAFEHSSVLNSKVFLEDKGYEVELFQPNVYGKIDPQKISQKIRESTELVSIIGVHNEMGTIQDIVELKRSIKSANSNTIFHVDGVQWFGKYKMPIAENMPDFLTFSAHKFHGPRGIGGILKNPQIPLKPLIHGGGQESRFRSGTENLPAIAGLTQALLDQDLRIKPLLQSLQVKIFNFASNHATIKWIGYPPGENRSPFINLIAIKNKKSEVLIHQLAEMEIYISSGSACSEKNGKNQSNWSFLDLPTEYQDGILRISFSYETNENEVNMFLQALDKII